MTVPIDELVAARPRRTVSPTMRAITVTAAALVVTAWVVVAVAWPLLVPFDPDRANVGPVLAGPSPVHLLGTDDLGRDVFSRMLAGASTVFLVAPLATLLQIVVGAVIGAIAGIAGRVADAVAMRTMDLAIVVPTIIALIIVVRVLGVSAVTMILVIGLAGVPTLARQVRNHALRLRSADFVTAARLRGEGWASILFVEIMPNLVPLLVVETVVRFGWTAVASTSLAFLGLSWQPPSPDWGLTIDTMRVYLQVQPWTVLAPAAALVSLMIAVGGLGEAASARWRSR
jgi:peptide/nickel transport system permease protein